MLLAPGLGDQHPIDHAVEQHRVDLRKRHLLRLLRQALLRRLDIGKGEFTPLTRATTVSAGGKPAPAAAAGAAERSPDRPHMPRARRKWRRR